MKTHRSQITALFLCSLIALSSAAVFLSCSESLDLGDERPIEATFTEDAPSWDNGIQTVFKDKCANCHTSLTNRSIFVPANTPSSINGISRSSFFDDTTNAGLIYDRIFSDTINPMPPIFATPLTDTERTKVKAWLETKTASIESLCGTTGSSSNAFEDVQGTIAADCGSCHNGVSRPSLGSLASAKQYRRTMITYLNEGIMPPSNATYKTTTAGAALYNWLCFGSDI